MRDWACRRCKVSTHSSNQMWAGPFLSADLEVAAGSPLRCVHKPIVPGDRRPAGVVLRVYQRTLKMTLSVSGFSPKRHSRSRSWSWSWSWSCSRARTEGATWFQLLAWPKQTRTQYLRSPVGHSTAQQHHVCCFGHGTLRAYGKYGVASQSELEDRTQLRLPYLRI